MITTCPHCATAFEVSSVQLAAKAGLVRCGSCRQVFNGYRGLSIAAPASAGVQSKPEPLSSILLAPLQPADPAVPQAIAAAEALLAEPEPQPQPVAAQQPYADDDETHASERNAEPEPDGARDDRRVTAVPAESWPTLSAPRVQEPLYQPSLHVAPSSSSWTLGALALLLALLLQVAYLWRADLAQRWPQSRVLLESMCDLLGCDVPAARELSQLNIDASTLEADTARPGVFVLQTTLQNVAPFVQRYPHLELTLTGVNEDKLAVKLFAPRDYLGAQHNPQHGWAPKETRAVSLHLDAGAVAPAGFRLRLLYP